MKETKIKLILSVFVILSLIAFAGTSWSAISYPTAVLDDTGGNIQTTAGIGTGTLVFNNVRISRVNYQPDGTEFAIANGPGESIINAQVVISGATRTGPLTFSDATLEIQNPIDSFPYLTGTLTNITFVELYPGVYYLNVALDADNPATLNLIDIVLNTDISHPSRFIDESANELGTNDFLGLKLGFFVTGGDITGNGTGDIFDGLLDAVTGPTNTPPTAEAGVTFLQEQCLATECEVTLDGSESTDPDSTPEYNDIVSYEWFEDVNNDGIYEISELIATGEIATVILPLGFHEITLLVTDSQGATDVDIITVVIDAAELSFIEITKAVVHWNYDWVKIKGKIALPAGISHFNVNAVGHAAVSLSTLGAVVDESVVFEVRGNDKKWKYHANHNDLGIHRFKIDWHGAKFQYKNESLEIKSRHFGYDKTTLEIEAGNHTGPHTIIIGDVTVSIDENDVVTVTPDTIEVDIDYHKSKTEVELVLPFALATTDVIDISGTVTDNFLVGDYYRAAVGKFKLKAKFDSTGIDPTTLEPSLTLDVALGDEGFSGILFIGPDVWTKITDNKWKFKLRH